MFKHLLYNQNLATKNVPFPFPLNGNGTFSIFLKGDERMTFDEAHVEFIRYHLKYSTGERRGRLERGHRHGEVLLLRNVWWPLRGSFEDLHPEYEVLDWRGRAYFTDLAWLPGYVKLLFEIKGYDARTRHGPEKILQLAEP
jgi:hypothetical protein